MSRQRNDWIRTGASTPSLLLRLGVVAVVAVGALLLVPVVGWQVIAVVTAALGVFLPQTFGGWLAIGCLAIGMLIGEPSIWRAMLAVLVVHICHVAFTLLLAIPIRSRIVLAALLPTLRRLLLVQLVVQPLTVLVMLLFRAVGAESADSLMIEAAPIAGTAALAAFVILFLLRGNRTERGS